MVLVYTQLIYGALLAFFFILFLWARSKPMALFSMFGVVLLLVVMQVSASILVIVALVLIAVYWNFNSKKNAQNKLLLPVLLLLVLSSVTLAAPQPPGILKFVNEVGKVTQQPLIEVQGTDYYPFDEGKLQAYLSAGDYPIDNAACYVSVLYPNMTYFIENAFMYQANITYFEGLYFRDFTVPNVTGVYPVNAHCFYNATVNDQYPSFYKLSNPDIWKEGTIDVLQRVDNVYMELENCGGDCGDINSTINFTIPLYGGWYNDFLYRGTLEFRFFSDNNDNTLRWFVYSPSQDKEYSLLNYTDPEKVWVSYSIDLSDFQNPQEFANDTSVIVGVRIYDFDSAKFFLDNMEIALVYNGSYVQDLRGNDELVVSRGAQLLSLEVFGEQEFLSGEIVVSIGILVGAILLFFAGQFALAGLLLLLWALFFGQETELLVQIFLWLMGFLLVYWGVIKKKAER